MHRRRRPTEIETNAGSFGPLAAVLLFIAASVIVALLLGGGQ